MATPWIYSEHYTKNPYAANTYDVYLEVHGKSGTGLLTARISVDGAVVREGVFVAAEPVKLFYHLR